MHEFNPLEFSKKDFRDSLRYKEGFKENPTERLDHAQTILSDALQGHGHETLTHENFDKVMKTMQHDPRWTGLHGAGPVFENALRTHLKMEPHEHESH